MIKDKFKSDIAKITAKAFVNLYKRDDLAGAKPPPLDFDKIYSKLETPRNPEMGNYALPLFDIAKAVKISPVKLNKMLVEEQTAQLKKRDINYLSFDAVSGFNNSRVDTSVLARHTLTEILSKGDRYGSSDPGQKKNIVIDFSSPNIAKPFGVGHLRSTAIGHSLYRIFEKLGYNSVGINHLGDWGTQFGKLIVAFRKWGSEEELKKDPIKKLFDLYVKFHEEEKNDPVLSDQAREAFKDLEAGDQDAATLWHKFKEYSLAAFDKTYQTLGVKFDYYTGESFYNDKMEPVIKRLEELGLTEISEGAEIINLEKFGLLPCLIRRADGATLYATRDIAGVIYRWETYNFEKALYVVNVAQRDHFKQVFKVIELLDEAEGRTPEEKIAPRLKHVEFGWIKFQDKMMSTRKGTIVLLEDVLDKAISLAKEKILEKNPDLADLEKVAKQIGVGAVVFADLATRKDKDVNFDWDEVLNFEGETGPYLQYTHARLSSLLRHYNKAVPEKIDYTLLAKSEEARVIDLLYKFPQTIYASAEMYEPYLICAYLLELASAFNKVYQRKDSEGRIDKIISDDEKQTEARMTLVAAVRTVIKEGLYLLGIEAPEAM
jgi:arginyl-tRNA synthetase